MCSLKVNVILESCTSPTAFHSTISAAVLTLERVNSKEYLFTKKMRERGLFYEEHATRKHENKIGKRLPTRCHIFCTSRLGYEGFSQFVGSVFIEVVCYQDDVFRNPYKPVTLSWLLSKLNFVTMS